MHFISYIKWTTLMYIHMHTHIHIHAYTYIQIHRPSSYQPPADEPHCRWQLPADLKRRNCKSSLKLRIDQHPGYQDQVVERHRKYEVFSIFKYEERHRNQESKQNRVNIKHHPKASALLQFVREKIYTKRIFHRYFLLVSFFCHMD